MLDTPGSVAISADVVVLNTSSGVLRPAESVAAKHNNTNLAQGIQPHNNESYYTYNERLNFLMAKTTVRPSG